MTEMIERVARALMKVSAQMPGHGSHSQEFPVLCSDPDFDDLPADSSEGTTEDDLTQEAVLKLARAAIEAMREPTPEMIRAVKPALKHHIESLPEEVQARMRRSAKHGIRVAFATKHKARWRAMIDEALKPTA